MKLLNVPTPHGHLCPAVGSNLIKEKCFLVFSIICIVQLKKKALYKYCILYYYYIIIGGATIAKVIKSAKETGVQQLYKSATTIAEDIKKQYLTGPNADMLRQNLPSTYKMAQVINIHRKKTRPKVKTNTLKPSQIFNLLNVCK